jgi:hypothetical protein
LAIPGVVPVGLDPEEIDIVDPMQVVPAAIGIADVGFPASRVGPVEAARMTGGPQPAVEAIAAVEGVREVTGRRDASGPRMTEVADAFDTECSHAVLLTRAMPAWELVDSSPSKQRSRAGSPPKTLSLLRCWRTGVHYSY